MPEYLDDPSVLTKDKLKSELVAHNVELPSGNPTKDVYVQLYLKNLTVQNQKNAVAVVLDAFSSDEELPPVVAPNRRRSSGRKAARKSDKHHLDVASLTDESLRDELQKHGMKVGPIVDSTRELYQKKLQKFLDDSPAQLFPTEIQVNHNGNSEPEVYSDTEDVAVAVPEPVIEPELVPVVETQVRSRGKSPASSHNSSSSSQNQAVEKITASDQMLKVEKDVLKELFPDINSPTGISASCRKPIRGAARRPLVSSDLWSDENSCLSSKTTKTSSYSYIGSHAVNRMSSLNPSTSFTSSSSSSSKLSVTAPSAGPTRAVRCSMTLWKKLALFAILATFVIFVYLAMETNSVSPFQASDSKSFASGTA